MTLAHSKTSTHFGIRFKLILAFFSITVILLIPMIATNLFTSEEMHSAAEVEIRDLIDEDLHNIADSTYHLIETHNAAVQQKVNNDLEVAQYLLQQEGGLRQCSRNNTFTSDAMNQFSGQIFRVSLPTLCVGNTQLRITDSFDTPVPVIDTVQELVGGTVTLFQRINAEGDLLRIATNVPTIDGQRAVNTFIPAQNLNGTPNEVVSAILRGETYRGLAYVVNDWYVTAYEPLFDSNGEVFAVLYVGVRQEEFGTLMQSLADINIGQTGYVFIIGGHGDDRGEYILSQDRARDGESIWNVIDADGRYIIREMVEGAVNLGSQETFVMHYTWENPGDDALREEVESLMMYYEPWDWVIGFHANISDHQVFFNELNTQQNNAMNATYGVGAMAIVLSGAFMWYTSRSVTNPIVEVADASESLAGGDLSQRVMVRSSDEIGVMAKGFNSMADSLKERIEAEQIRNAEMQHVVADYIDFIEQVSDGDLMVRLNVDNINQPELQRLGLHMNEMVDRLSQMARQVRSSASDVLETSLEIQAAASQQASTSAEQDASVAQTLAMMEEVSTIVRQTAESMEEVARAARESAQVSQTGKNAVTESIAGMQRLMDRVNSISATINELAQHTQQIGEIIQTVSEIADQSKLLALNASIEAARAGKQGQGFAVVSNEVRALADQSQKATTRITDILNEIQRTTATAVKEASEGREGAEGGLELVAHAGEAIRELAQVIEESAQEASRISGNTRQQNESMSQLASAMSAIKQASLQAASSAAQADKSAQALNEMARLMEDAVTRYTLDAEENNRV